MKLNRNIFILFATLVVVMLGFGIVIPILPFYLEQFGVAGKALGILMAIFSTMQFLFAPMWGGISDRIGRKPVLVIGITGNALAMLFFGLSTQLWMLFASRALSGILSSATLPTAMAYISDSTSTDQRGRGMGIMGAAMGLGMVLGPGLGGWLAETSLNLPFFIAAALSAITALIVLLIVPESLPSEEREVNDMQISGPNFKEMFSSITSPIGILLVMAFLLSFGLTNFEGVFGLFALQKFNYGPKEVGLILTVMGLSSALIQGILTGPLTKRLGEIPIIRISFIGSAIGFIVMLYAVNLPTVLITVSIFIISNTLLRPVVSSLTSKWATTRQGIALGLNSSFMSLGRVFGPLWAGFLFDIDLDFPYMSGAVIMLVGFIVSIIFLSRRVSTIQDSDY